MTGRKLDDRIALVDDGTGSSLLNRLGRLPVDIVKIDKTFIDQLTLSREGRAPVQSVLDVTRTLGMSSTTESVEQHAQREALEEMECDRPIRRPFPVPHVAPSRGWPRR